MAKGTRKARGTGNTGSRGLTSTQLTSTMTKFNELSPREIEQIPNMTIQEAAKFDWPAFAGVCESVPRLVNHIKYHQQQLKTRGPQALKGGTKARGGTKRGTQARAGQRRAAQQPATGVGA